MTISELYASIDGDYEQAKRVLRMDRLIDKHIRRFKSAGVGEQIVAAGRAMDAQALFESAHAMKGVCGNLGLVKLAEAANEITEEFRPGHARTMSDDEVREKIAAVETLYRNAIEGIERYEAQA